MSVKPTDPAPCDSEPSPTTLTPWRVLLFVAIYGAIFLSGKWFGSWLTHSLSLGPSDLGKGWTSLPVWIALLIYVALLALPFVPGMEISIALFAAFGSAIALPIYLATVLALALAYLLGRTIPPHGLAAAFGILGLVRARDLVNRLAPLDPDQRLAVLLERAPGRWLATLMRYRYLAIVVAFNVPGNAVIGGGGGIALLAGLSGLFSYPGYLLAVAVAVLPIPLTIALLGHVS
ncbi:MAG: hypothetical protein R3D44_13380 [Hyphomicrobiaceae bacterium]